MRHCLYLYFLKSKCSNYILFTVTFRVIHAVDQHVAVTVSRYWTPATLSHDQLGLFTVHIDENTSYNREKLMNISVDIFSIPPPGRSCLLPRLPGVPVEDILVLGSAELVDNRGFAHT